MDGWLAGVGWDGMGWRMDGCGWIDGWVDGWMDSKKICCIEFVDIF